MSSWLSFNRKDKKKAELANGSKTLPKDTVVPASVTPVDDSVDEFLTPNGAFQQTPAPHTPTAEESYLDLEASLFAMAEDQPRVARSTPRGVVIPYDSSSPKAIDRQTRHCIYAPQVYDEMLNDSLNVCAQIQHNLDDYVCEVRHSNSTEFSDNARSELKSADGEKTDLEPKIRELALNGELTVINAKNGIEEQAANGKTPSVIEIEPVKNLMKNDLNEDTKGHKRRVLRFKFP